MNGQLLRFYAHEDRRIHGVALYEWLLSEAKRVGIQGGTAFKAMAGFGRHGVVHESKFFELAGQLAVEVEFIASEEQAQKLLAFLAEQRVAIFYARIPAEFGIVEGD